MEFSVGSCISFGWEIFKKRPLFLIGTFLLISLGSSIINGIFSNVLGHNGIGPFISFLINIVIQVFVGIAYVSLSLKAHDSIETLELKDLWRPEFFLQYLLTSTVVFVIVMVGLVLLIIPGIIAALMFSFSSYLVVDRSLPVTEALKESSRITRGHRLDLLWLLFVVFGINVVGLLCLIVGLLVTIPVSMLAIVHAYRVLEQKANASAAA